MSLRPRQVDFDSVWLGIRDTSLGVITLATIDRSTWNDRFADVYYLCVAYPEPQASRLYRELKTFIRDHVRDVYSRVKMASEASVLAVYLREWQVFRQGAIYLDKLFMYLNNQHLRKKKMSLAELVYGSVEVDGVEAGVLEVRELALSLWRRQLLEPLQQLLVTQLLWQIERQRAADCGDAIGDATSGGSSGGGGGNCAATVRGVVDSLVEVEAFRVHPLELYESVFETAYLVATGKYFRQLAAALSQQLDVYRYVERVLRLVGEERQRCVSYLNATSVEPVMSEVRARLVEDHLPWLLSEAPLMVRTERHQALGQLYQLLRPLSSHEPLQLVARAFEEHVRAEGVQQVEAALRSGASSVEQPAMFVDAVLSVCRHYRRLVVDVFSSDQLFVSTLERACGAAVNHRSADQHYSAVPELVCRYVDLLLRRAARSSGADVTGDVTLDDRLSAAVSVFKFLEDKDAFQKHYQKLLCKRLMFDSGAASAASGGGTSSTGSNNMAAIDCEELMVSKLKQACGYDFTNKLSQMLRDMGVSHELGGQFAGYLAERRPPVTHAVAVRVLQSGAWPVSSASVVSFSVPRQLAPCLHHFDAFYRAKFAGRRLTWLHHLSAVDLRLGYLARLHLVTLHTFAGAILLLFEHADRLSRAEIATATALPAEHLSRNLHALVDSRLLLLHSSSGATSGATGEACGAASGGDGAAAAAGVSSGGDSDMYALNMEFTCRRTRFRVQTTAPAREQAVDVEVSRREMDECRKMCVQAAIVRIMKTRKRQRHGDLVREVVGQTCALFVPQVAMIKKCIEVLIDKEYMTRVANSADEYSYVA